MSSIPLENSDARVWRLLQEAQRRQEFGDEEGAEGAYLTALRMDGENFDALNDFGRFAHRRGRRTAARLAHERSLRLRPRSPVAHVNLANILMEDGAVDLARGHYLDALTDDAGFAPAHRGLARCYEHDGDPRAETHWRLSGRGGVEHRPKRGAGPAIPVLLLASMRLGNMPVAPWLDDGLFDVTIIEVEHFPLDAPLPPHALILNLVADADLCGEALRRAAHIAALSSAPLLNAPADVAMTGRIDIATRLAGLSGVETAEIRRVAKIDARNEAFPLLMRAPGFHAGRHFLRVDRVEDMPAALDVLPGDDVLLISLLDAKGPDGRYRKFRAMRIGGRWFPLHLAISSHWMVHYFSADMAADPKFRAEERWFLEDMPAVLGARGFAALDAIAERVKLDYFGVDFGLAPDGTLRVFEANAAMAMLDPPPEAMWDYRRPALAAAREGARGLAVETALHGAPTRSRSASPAAIAPGSSPSFS